MYFIKVFKSFLIYYTVTNLNNFKGGDSKMSSFLYVYIDESGDLGKYGSKYFTVAAVIVEDQQILKRIIKKVRQRKLKKTIKQLPELKANNSDRLTREAVLNYVKKANCSIFAIVVEKDHIMNHLFEIKNKLYNYLCGILMEKIIIPSNKLVIIIDKKHTNTLMREDFNSYIKNKLSLRESKLEIEIHHKESFSLNELQVVDFIAWSINRKFNSNDDYYYKFIEEKILNREEMILWKNK